MDFLDPKKERQNQTKLLLGYCLVALAIGIATLVLLYQAYGYGIDRQGEVTQSGLLFVASQPSNAAITLNGQPYKNNTDTRVQVPAAKYMLHISKTGYRPWDRPVIVAGGDVQRFDYPLLFPVTLKTSSLADLNGSPSVAMQSPDKRWLILGQPDDSGVFTEYDLKNPAKPVATTLTLPADSFTPGDGAQTWTMVEWSTDSRHVLLQHTYVTGANTNHEYVLLDRDTPADSLDITNKLNLTQADTVNLFNNRTDQFYVYSSTNQTLKRVNGNDASVISTLGHILAFKTSGDDKILYVTDQSPTGKATPGLVSAVLQDGQQTVTLRTLPLASDGIYALNLAQYSSDWYVAVASSADTAAYLYKNPQSQTGTGPDTYPAPWRRIQLNNPSFFSFSSNTQFLLAESGQNFVVYDLENIAQYRYTAAEPIDQPQTHAAWMDGDRLTYVSGGKLEVFDYDYHNRQSLVAADAAYSPFFSGDFSYLYALRPATDTTKAALTSTPLVVK